MYTNHRSYGIFFLLLLPIFLACAPTATPWDIDIPEKYRNLTTENLQRLPQTRSSHLPFTFAIIGDPQGTPGDFHTTLDRINDNQEVAFALVLGDMTDYGLKHEYVWAAEAIQRSQVPVMTVIGNHDAISFGKKIYQSMFGAFNYTFEYSGIRFVMWNNNLLEFGETNFDWLTEVSDERSIIASHIPPVVDIHNAEQIIEWQKINENAGIISSLHGHRGGQRSFYWQEKDVPYYVVARNRGGYYALVTVTEEHEVKIKHCQTVCQEEGL
ncbi:MAG: metallophosphoesterase family protein [Oligoflexus sp.]